MLEKARASGPFRFCFAILRPMFRILVVCLGNICRSPIAHSVLHHGVQAQRLDALVEIDSAGTYAGHEGSRPDRRAIAAATARGYPQIARQRARRVLPLDFERFDLILAMDRPNLQHLQGMCPPGQAHKVHLFLEYAGLGGNTEVPDPYYGNAAGFEHVMDLCEAGARAVLARTVAGLPQAR
jgi:protein-tyrosine phosphatase